MIAGIRGYELVTEVTVLKSLTKYSEDCSQWDHNLDVYAERFVLVAYKTPCLVQLLLNHDRDSHSLVSSVSQAGILCCGPSLVAMISSGNLDAHFKQAAYIELDPRILPCRDPRIEGSGACARSEPSHRAGNEQRFRTLATIVAASNTFSIAIRTQKWW